MEKINLTNVTKALLGLAAAGLLFFTVHSFYGEDATPSPTTTVMAQDTTFLLTFKSMRGFKKPADSLSTELEDRGCQPVNMDVIIIGNEVHLVHKGEGITTTDVFKIIAANPENPSQVLVEDTYGRRILTTMLCIGENPEADPNHAHWFVIENLEEFAVYSTNEGECEFLK